MTSKQILYGGIVIVVLLALVWLLSLAADKTTPGQNEEEGEQIAEMEALSGNGEFALDPAQSEIEWTGSKTLIASYEDSGSLEAEGGEVSVQNGVVTGGTIVFDMTTITGMETSNTENTVDRLTTHLKSADFFDVENFPTATFTIASVAPSTEGENMYTANGTLTMKGKTNPVTFPAQIYMNDGMVHVDADITIDRTLWDVRFGSGKFFQDLGDNVIDDEFDVDAHVVFVPQGTGVEVAQ